MRISSFIEGFSSVCLNLDHECACASHHSLARALDYCSHDVSIRSTPGGVACSVRAIAASSGLVSRLPPLLDLLGIQGTCFAVGDIHYPHPLLFCVLIHPLHMSLPENYNILVVPLLFLTKSTVRDLANLPSTHLCCRRAPMLLSTFGWLDRHLGWCWRSAAACFNTVLVLSLFVHLTQ